jgi:hypothetical protein
MPPRCFAGLTLLTVPFVSESDLNPEIATRKRAIAREKVAWYFRTLLL